MRVCDVCKKTLDKSFITVTVVALGGIRHKLNELGFYGGTDLEFDFCDEHGIEVVQFIQNLEV